MSGTVSIHAFRGEGDDWITLTVKDWHVSIHAFRGEGDLVHLRATQPFCKVSIHAFRGEGDQSPPPRGSRRFRFNPRLPGGRRPIAEGRILV